MKRAEQDKQSAEQKFQDLSYRVDELEEIIDGKNERIQELESGQDGYVMVEEDLLHNIESSFANFQGLFFWKKFQNFNLFSAFLEKLNTLGLGELTKMVETSEPINEENLAAVRNRILSSDSYLTSSWLFRVNLGHKLFSLQFSFQLYSFFDFDTEYFW